MGRPERPLDSVQDPIGEFASDLRALRSRAGNPSYRRLARSAMFAPSVLSSAASGHRLPSLPVTLAFVAACGGEPTVWERRWRELAAAQGTAPPPEKQDAPPTPPRSPSTVDRTGRAPAAARPAQLPMGTSTFVGRDQALADAARLATHAGPALMISGPIGAGKTTFALRLADELSAALPDGQLYADLSAATSSATGVVPGFLHALGVPPAYVPDDATSIGLFRTMLAQRRLFVLLENATDERQVRPLLGRSTSSLIVVTSRARLLGLDGVHRIDLGVLTRPESLTLIGRLAGEERIRAELDAADALAELCGDLPLAVSVVGRRIAARPEWTVAGLAGALADAERVMASLSVGDVKVRDIFAAAYRRLTPTARQALHELVAAGATAGGVAASMGIGVDAADELLESLVDSGLLTRADSTGRYGMSALVRAFAMSTPHAAPAPASAAATKPEADTIVSRRMNLGRADLPPRVRANALSFAARGDVLA
ncbi:AAA family ATPase [Dactylosporangium cerinum]